MSTQDACNQRKLFLQFNIPASRLTKQSPYDGTVTQEQLNMRRKVEILKYKTNNTSGASLSQKQEFARISRGNYNVGRVSCTADAIRPVSSRNSNIEDWKKFYEHLKQSEIQIIQHNGVFILIQILR